MAVVVVVVVAVARIMAAPQLTACGAVSGTGVPPADQLPGNLQRSHQRPPRPAEHKPQDPRGEQTREFHAVIFFSFVVSCFSVVIERQNVPGDTYP